MGYLFLLITLLSGAAKGYCGKRTSGYVTAYSDAMLANVSRMVFCVAIGFCVIAAAGQLDALTAGGKVLLISLLAAAGSAAFVVLWLVSVKSGAYMMLDVFCMMSILIPIAGSVLFFGEPLRWNHIVGALLLVAAALLMCSYNNSIKERLTVSSVVLLVLCSAASGLADFSQKMFTHLAADTPNAVFQFYTYLFSAVILAVCYGLFHKKEETQGTEPFRFRAIIGYIAVMSLCLFLNSFCKTQAAEYLPAAQLYPLVQGGALALSAMMAAVFFHERLSKKAAAGLAISFAALLIINFF